MKTIKLILTVMISVAVMGRRHHHSDIEQLALTDIESMFKLMNDFSPIMPVQQEFESFQSVVAVDDNKVGGI